MARQEISLKQLAINKDNTAIIVAVGLAAFFVVFSIVASNALLKQRSYQARVIAKKKVALKQLKTNANEIDKLKTSYQSFADSQQNVLGGNSKGSGDKDGENPRIVLDALPSKYDFPGMTTSLEKMFKQYQIRNITGTDDEVAQSAAKTSVTPKPVGMPFTIGLTGSPQAVKPMLETFEKSIRPFQIKSVKLNGASAQVELTIEAKTYFQPQKKFDVKMEKVK